jgi:hypothetical protein
MFNEHKEKQMNEWKLEDQLTNDEIEKIMEKDIAIAKELVDEKQQEALIYITYLRKEADRLESQLELLEIRLQQKIDKEWLDKMNALTTNKKIIANRANNTKRRGLSVGRQKLITRH